MLRTYTHPIRGADAMARPQENNIPPPAINPTRSASLQIAQSSAKTSDTSFRKWGADGATASLASLHRPRRPSIQTPSFRYGDTNRVLSSGVNTYLLGSTTLAEDCTRIPSKHDESEWRIISTASTVFNDAPRSLSPEPATYQPLEEDIAEKPTINQRTKKVASSAQSPEDGPRTASSNYGSLGHPRSPVSPPGSPVFLNNPNLIPELSKDVATLRRRFFSNSSETSLERWTDPAPKLSLEVSTDVTRDPDNDSSNPRDQKQGGTLENTDGSGSDIPGTQYDNGTVIRRSLRRPHAWQDGPAENTNSEDGCTMGSLLAIKSHMFSKSEESKEKQALAEWPEISTRPPVRCCSPAEEDHPESPMTCTAIVRSGFRRLKTWVKTLFERRKAIKKQVRKTKPKKNVRFRRRQRGGVPETTVPHASPDANEKKDDFPEIQHDNELGERPLPKQRKPMFAGLSSVDLC